MKKTLVLGASQNPERYSYKAIQKLTFYGHEVVAVGKRKGNVGSVQIHETMPEVNDIDTITLYLNPHNQEVYYDAILHLRPKRIIFNPGTENPELEYLAQKNNIETIEACTLVLLSIGEY